MGQDEKKIRVGKKIIFELACLSRVGQKKIKNVQKISQQCNIAIIQCCNIVILIIATINITNLNNAIATLQYCNITTIQIAISQQFVCNNAIHDNNTHFNTAILHIK